ncbi:39312_t:CDS:2, partial [Gigaspora margarita]
PIQIRVILRNKFEILNINAKQIHYWWLAFAQDSYKLDDDQEKESQEYLRTNALADFFNSIQSHGLNLSYFYTDKDFAEINAAKEAWPQADIQLYQWHIERAITEKLKSKKRIQYIQYQPEEAIAKFSFINSNFKPDLKCSEPEYYQVCPLNLRNNVINLIKKHFNLHPKIPVNANGIFLTSAEIRENAVLEIYNFCVNNNFIILWPYLWSSWYKISRWCFWARLIRATIPISKMNMMIEAHWKALKHCYFYQFKQNWNQLAARPIANSVKECYAVDLDCWQQSSHQQPTIFSANNDEGVNLDLYLQYEVKVAELEYLAKHLREELTINNLQHIKNIVNNMDHVFTIIKDIKLSQYNSKCTNTWNTKPWTMFLQ